MRNLVMFTSTHQDVFFFQQSKQNFEWLLLRNMSEITFFAKHIKIS